MYFKVKLPQFRNSHVFVVLMFPQLKAIIWVPANHTLTYWQIDLKKEYIKSNCFRDNNFYGLLIRGATVALALDESRNIVVEYLAFIAQHTWKIGDGEWALMFYRSSNSSEILSVLFPISIYRALKPNFVQAWGQTRRDSRKIAMDILREFLQTSTVHGLAYISTEKVIFL